MAPPKHIVAVSALVKNDKGEILLVRTHSRSDTWEIPGGQVEVGEPLHIAMSREIEEETGIIVEPVGITGVYYNTSIPLVSIVFVAKYISGQIRKQEEEILDARFINVDTSNIDEYVKRPHFKSRILDALEGRYVPFEVWDTRTYTLQTRIDN
jgi:8-oxo-dGTP diphosphatase